MSDFAFLAIGVFGFTYLLRWLDGPFDVLKHFRMFMGIKYISVYESYPNESNMKISGEIEEIPNKFFAKLVGCFWCLSTWVSIFFCVTYAILHGFGIFETFVGIFICVGISGTVNEFVRKT